ncbi:MULTISPECIES: hypothetical protein [Methylobacterium]|nr:MULTISPECIES: hypothetical protein [Methylobacterium]MCI9881955.1 hypothetical protein [Methylobacterium goesingense]
MPHAHEFSRNVHLPGLDALPGPDRVPAYVLARLAAWKRSAPAREEAP